MEFDDKTFHKAVAHTIRVELNALRRLEADSKRMASLGRARQKEIRRMITPALKMLMRKAAGRTQNSVDFEEAPSGQASTKEIQIAETIKECLSITQSFDNEDIRTAHFERTRERVSFSLIGMALKKCISVGSVYIWSDEIRAAGIRRRFALTENLNGKPLPSYEKRKLRSFKILENMKVKAERELRGEYDVS